MNKQFNPDFQNLIPDPELSKEQEPKFSPEMIRAEYFNSYEEQLLKIIEKWRVGNETEDRKLEKIDSNGKTVAYIDRVCKPDEDKQIPGRHDLWLVVDFDDVLNQTTLYNEKLGEYFCELTGASSSEFNRLYEESKIANDFGKKVLRFDKLIEKIKNLYPDKRDEIDQVMDREELGPDKFINQSVKRALMAIQDKYIQGNDNVRISILTFGDLNYQKKRIDETGIAEIVNEIIYTEGSKNEVLDTILKKDYKELAPFIITVDDSPENIDDYEKIDVDNRRFVNMHYRHPKAKRFNKISEAPLVISNIEDEPGKAAMKIYLAAKLALQQNMQEDRFDLYRNFKDLRVYYEGYAMSGFSSTQSLEFNIKYYQEADNSLVREYDYRLKYESSESLTHKKITI